MSLSFRNGPNPIDIMRLNKLGILMLCLPGVAQSAQWSLKGTIDQFLGYDSNVRMQEKAEGSFHYKLIPVLSFIHKTDATEVKANAMYGTQIYTDIIGLDQDIQNYDINGIYKTQQFDWGLALSHSATPTRNNADQSSGNFGASSINTTQTVSPSLTYRLSELDTLSFTPSYSVTTFTNADAASFRNYNTLNLNLAWQRQWTERYSTTVSGFYSNFESEQNRTLSNSSSFDSYGINFGNNYLVSQNWTLNGTIGIRRTDSQSGLGVGSTPSTDSSLGFLANLTADYKADNYNSGVYFERSLSPSNQGQLQEQTSVGWYLNYRITERLSADFNIHYLDSTKINQIDQVTRENIVLQPGVKWQITPEWTIGGSYRYRTQNSNEDNFGNPGASRSAESHLIMLTINYNWQGLSIAR